MQKLIDAHCHLGNGVTDKSVMAFVCNTVTESQWVEILSAAQQNTHIYPCLGIHPWYVEDASNGWDTRLHEYLIAYPHAMVGEIGLDKTRPNYAQQVDIFTRSINIAHQMGRVIHIHCVHAWNDMLKILSDYKWNLPAIVFHGFSANIDIMTQLARHENVYFSFGRMICDPRRTKFINTVSDVPLSRILIESDGDMCDSGNVLKDVINKIADIRQMSLEDIAQIIYDNATGVIRNG